MAELHGPLPAQAIDHLAKGDMIGAIRVIRIEWGLGLKDAKDAAENYIRSQPELAALYAQRAAAGRRSVLIFFIAALLAALAAMAAIRFLR